MFTMSILCGTVFQTALPLLLIIPRLRPGLLSLRSVLSSRQIFLPTTNLERSTGFQTKLLTNYKHGVLSGRQYPIDMLTRLWLTRRVQNLSRITPMRRICSFHGFLCVLLDFVACRAQWLSRIISCWRLDRLHCSKLLQTTKSLNNYPAPYRRKNNP